MNEIIETIISRHAIRRFQDRQIEESDLQQILTAGLYAPSAGNNQYSRIVVSQDKEINLALGKLSREVMFHGAVPAAAPVAGAVSMEQPSIKDDPTIMDGFYGAPTAISIFTRDTRYAHDDAAFIAENMWLAAHALGIGACYIGRTDEVFATEYGMELRKKWGIPDDMAAVGNLILGYPEGDAPHDKPRKEGRIIRV
jgi:nitroreductase